MRFWSAPETIPSEAFVIAYRLGLQSPASRLSRAIAGEIGSLMGTRIGRGYHQVAPEPHQSYWVHRKRVLQAFVERGGACVEVGQALLEQVKQRVGLSERLPMRYAIPV